MLREAVQEKPVDYGPPDYDGLWKRVIGDLFEEFMLFFASDLHGEIDFDKAPNFLDQELYKEVIEGKKGKNIADQIVRVHLKNGEDKWVLIHIEIQGEDSNKFSDRMFRYFYRIYDKYDKKVYAIALMTDDKGSIYPSYFHYDFFGTIVDYKYNVYKFHEHRIQELEQSKNPFAIAIIAGKYANRYKKYVDKRFYFKRKLMLQILKKYSQHQEKPRTYITALFYFIDYLLQTPEEYKRKLGNELIKSNYKDGEQGMHAEKEVLSPTLAYMLNVIKERELAKAEKKGMEAGIGKGIEQGIEQGIEKGLERGIEQGIEKEKINLAKKLIKEDFEDEQIAELTGLELQQVVEIKKLLQD